MYQITTSSGVIGYADQIDYCCKLSSGSPQVIGKVEREAGMTPTGIVFGGTVYNLPDHDDFEDSDTAYITKIDAANVLNEQKREIKAEQSARVDIENALCDADIANCAWQAEVENALCELDEGGNL